MIYFIVIIISLRHIVQREVSLRQSTHRLTSPPFFIPILLLFLSFLHRWVNSSFDTLQCVHCKSVLVVLIHPKLTKYESIRKIVKAYQSKLATAHKESCPFRLDAELHLLDNNNKMTVKRKQDSNIVPTYLASVLPRDVWELVEHPTPLSLVKDRFHTLYHFILKNKVEPKDGSPPPKWQFPDIVLPDDVLAFGVADPHKDDHEVAKEGEGGRKQGKTAGEKQQHTSPSKTSRMLSRLAFDPSKPYSAIGWEKQTLLTQLEEILRPHAKEDEIRAQTRAQGAWEALYEGIAALTLFGWMPPNDKDHHDAQSLDSDEKGSSVTLECPVCISLLTFELEKYDWHHHSHGRKAIIGDKKDDNEERPVKRRKLDHETTRTKLNPLLGHRYHCPFVCGFPKDGQRKSIPLWQTIAAKLLIEQKDKENEDGAGKREEPDDDESGLNRILQILESSVSSYRRHEEGR